MYPRYVIACITRVHLAQQLFSLGFQLGQRVGGSPRTTINRRTGSIAGTQSRHQVIEDLVFYCWEEGERPEGFKLLITIEGEVLRQVMLFAMGAVKTAVYRG